MVIIIIAAAGGFAIRHFVFVKDSQFESNAKGTQVTPVIGSEKADKTIDESGGEIDLVSGDVTSKLTLPEKAVSDSTSIEMKKIDSILGMPQGMGFISGVEFASDDTWLYTPADLQITVPSNQSLEKLIGFSYATGGKDFRFYPMQISGNQATFKLSGFSGYGILVLENETAAPEPPSTIERQAQQFIGRIVLEGRNKSGGLNADQTNRIGNLLDAWYKASLKGVLKDAEGNPDKIDSALREYKSWLVDVQLFGLDDRFASEINASLNSLALAIKNASDKAGKACTDEKDPVKATKLLHYYKITERLGLDGRSGLKSSDIQELVKKCVSFEVTIKSRMVSGDQYKSSVDAEGEGTITLGDDMKLSGSGQVTVTDYHMDIDGESCTASTPEVWPFTIPPFSLTEGGSNKLSMPFNLEEPPDVIWECGEKIRELTGGDPNSGVWSEGTAWDFDLTHQSETVDNIPVHYLLQDWDIAGSGGIFARKVYDRTVNIPLGFMNLPIQEQTTFELVHKPK